jgi:anaerobic magnesium-protoporphyrin IX monomethyl ester cyclase
MKDLLLFAPLDDFATAQYEFVPLGLLYLCSYIEQFGFEVDILHGDISEIKSGYKFYGISSTTGQYSMALKAQKKIREIQPDAKIILGGPHLNTSEYVAQSLWHGWEYLVVGDGEIPLKNILQREVFERVIYGVSIGDLDSLPFPAYHKIDMSKYNFPLRDGLKCINMITSRGCPFKCNFCTTSNKKFRKRSVENVIQEVDLLVNKYGFNALMFVDDTMSVDAQRYNNILWELEPFNIKWRSYGRTSTITFGALERMARSGCVECAPGIESGSQSILDLIEKGTSVEHNIDWCIRCEDVDIVCNPSLIIGLPTESPETVGLTRDFVKEVKPRAFSYNIFLPLRDSSIYQQRNTKYKGLITIYPYTWDDCRSKTKKITKCFVSTPELSREQILEEYHRYYDIFADITGFDPRQRGTRKYQEDLCNSRVSVAM